MVSFYADTVFGIKWNADTSWKDQPYKVYDLGVLPYDTALKVLDTLGDEGAVYVTVSDEDAERLQEVYKKKH